MSNSKSTDSNTKRLETLQKIRDEYNLKRKLVSNSLKDLDTKAIKNKKIIFDEDDENDDEFSVQPVLSIDSNKKELKKDEVAKEKNNKSSKRLLMSSSDESNSESEEETKKMFESKINLKEKEANQLIYLKSKYSNDDSRFKIDDRFIENDSSVSSSSESDEENDKDDDGVKLKVEEADENGVVEKNVIGKKHIKNENIKSLKILEEITGKTIKPQALTSQTSNSSNSNQKDSKKSIKSTNSEQIVRYDPTKDDHKKFEINSQSSDDSSDASSSDEDSTKGKSKKEKNFDDSTTKSENTKITEDKTVFYQIDSNLKQLFSSSDAFKFKFTNSNENESENNKFGKTTDIKPNPFKFTDYNNGNTNNRFNSSSDEEEEEYEDEDEEEECNDVEKEGEAEHENKETHEKRISNGNNTNNNKISNMKKDNKSTNINKPTIDNNFLPDLINSQLGKEVLNYFKRKTDDLSELRTDWSSKRDLLVQEYKKKHKRILRIQKNKNNEKLLSWKNSSSTSNIKK